jgi:hypothetical protein
MVVPPRYGPAVGKGEIKQSLNITDLGEARRSCATRQGEWLERFEAIETEEAHMPAGDKDDVTAITGET